MFRQRKRKPRVAVIGEGDLKTAEKQRGDSTMSDNERLSHIPSDYLLRKELWARSGLWLSSKKGPSVTLSVENLSYAERLLLEWEKCIAAIADDPARRTERESLLMECAAHSILWIFGLYEIVRVVKDTNPAKFD